MSQMPVNAGRPVPRLTACLEVLKAGSSGQSSEHALYNSNMLCFGTPQMCLV